MYFWFKVRPVMHIEKADGGSVKMAQKYYKIRVNLGTVKTGSVFANLFILVQNTYLGSFYNKGSQ